MAETEVFPGEGYSEVGPRLRELGPLKLVSREREEGGRGEARRVVSFFYLRLEPIDRNRARSAIASPEMRNAASVGVILRNEIYIRADAFFILPSPPPPFPASHFSIPQSHSKLHLVELCARIFHLKMTRPPRALPPFEVCAPRGRLFFSSRFSAGVRQHVHLSVQYRSIAENRTGAWLTAHKSPGHKRIRARGPNRENSKSNIALGAPICYYFGRKEQNGRGRGREGRARRTKAGSVV